jgi:hypothetical protein
VNTNAISGLSALAFFISSVVVAWLFAWPWLRTVNQVAVGIFALTLPLNLRVYILDDDFPAYQEQKKSTTRINILFCRFLGLVVLNTVGFTILFFEIGWLPGFLFAVGATGFVLSLLGGAAIGGIWRISRRVLLSLFCRVPSIETTNEGI